MTAGYPIAPELVELSAEEKLLRSIFGESARIAAPSVDEVEMALSRLREFGAVKDRLREAREARVRQSNQLHQLLKEQMVDVLSSLTPRERKVLELRFGLEDGRSRTLEEVGLEFNVTREDISQIEAEALRKLRHPTRSEQLSDYLNDEPRNAELPELDEFRRQLSVVRRAESYGWPHQGWVAELDAYVSGGR